MELNFAETIEGKEWVAEFEAPSDFNLHIERADSGSLVVSQRGTASGEYETAFVKGMYEGGIVIDCDFGALVYPKWIKVTSSSEVVSASVNFNEGGGSGSGSSDDAKWEYYKIDRNDASFDVGVMNNVYNYTTLDNVKGGGKIFICPSGEDFSMTAAIAGISVKYILLDSVVVDTGSWLGNVKESVKLLVGEDFDYSFLKPITKEEFYSTNFDYPADQPN